MALTADPTARRFARRGMVYALVWLVYLVYPLVDLLDRVHPLWQYPLALGGLVLLAVLYVGAWHWSVTENGLRIAGIWISVIGTVLTLVLGGAYAGIFIYAGAVYARLRSVTTFAALTAVNLCLMVAVALHAHLDIPSLLGIGFGAIGTTVGVRGIGALIAYTYALREAREEVARLARSEERERIARDLHDLLGHTLSLIVLKSEVAGRLMERDPKAAAGEIQELQEVARAALGEVREAVTGYLPRSLDGELERAARTLRAAGIAASVCDVPPSLPSELDAALALVVREAVTNVVRHSGASSCEISIALLQGWLELTVLDDGAAAEVPVPGNGIEGMRRRIEDQRGELRYQAGGGIHLTARLPLA